MADVAEDFDREFNVRDAPPDGDIIAKLPKGTKCTQIAQRERYFEDKHRSFPPDIEREAGKTYVFRV